jgi:hypothetical protein
MTVQFLGMELHCPECGLPIPASEIAPSAGLAVCRSCDQSFGIEACKTALPFAQRPQAMPTNPPKGVQVEESMDGFRISVTTRSALAWFLVPFMCIWSGGSLGGIYGTQIYKGEFSLFQSLFGIPFLFGTLLFGSIAMMALCGEFILEVRGDELRQRVGFLGLYWTRCRRWLDYDHAEIIESTSRSRRGGYQVQYQLLLKGKEQEYECGSGVSRERLAWVAKYLNGRIARGL